MVQELRETVEILELKVKKLEQLVRIKVRHTLCENLLAVFYAGGCDRAAALLSATPRQDSKIVTMANKLSSIGV